MRGLLRSIQARKLDRVAAAYAVAGWIFVQVAAIVLPTFGAPSWAMKILILVVAAGFPLALWIAWHAAAPHYRHSARQAPATFTDVALLALLGIVIILALAQITLQMGYLRAPLAWRPSVAERPTGGARPAQTPAEASIAVLPFLNMSGDPAKEYFSDGISEELLNDFSNIPNLRVAARTSSFAFKGRSEDIRQIAHALNVRTVLEGSVRENGSEIRITAQLINAADGYHIWSKTYDRDLSNILVVQDDIARAITGALTRGLLVNGTAARTGRPASIDPVAYREYLQGQQFSAQRTDDGDNRAIALFKDVIARQPDFGGAFAAMGRTYVHLAEFHDHRPDLLAAAETALDQALGLDPRNLEALSSRVVLRLSKWDWQGASDDAARLQSINPHSVFALRGLEFLYRTLGFPDSLIATLRETRKMDPLSIADLDNLADVLNAEGRHAEAAAAASAALALQANRPLVLYNLCWARTALNRAGDVSGIIERLSAMHASAAADGCRLRLAIATGHLAEARVIASRIATELQGFVFDETDVAVFFAMSGDIPQALIWIRQAFAHKNPYLFAIQYWHGTPPALLNAPGWRTLMEQPASKDWRTAHDRLAAQLDHR